MLVFLNNPARAIFLLHRCHYHKPPPVIAPYECALASTMPQIGATPPHLTPRTNLALNCEPRLRNFNFPPILEFFVIVKGNEKLILLSESRYLIFSIDLR
jgi:hypothetical protein